MFNDEFTNDFSLLPISPCIDAGTSSFYFDEDWLFEQPIYIEHINLDENYFGTNPDMGVYEYITEYLLGDLNNDNIINILDIVILVDIVLN